MENLSKKAEVDFASEKTRRIKEHLDDIAKANAIVEDWLLGGAKVLAVQGEIEEIKSMVPLARLKKLKNTRAGGGNWKQEYEHIRQVIDPYDAMTDTQVFGAEIPWEFWRD